MRCTKEIADAIERSLFAGGAALVRINADDDAFLMHPSLLEITTSIAVESGLIALAVREGEPGTTTARDEGTEIKVPEEPTSTDGDVGDAGGSSGASRVSKVVVAVHRLLNDTRVFISSEKAGL